MATSLEEKTISSLYWGCADSFRLLFEHLKKDGDVPEKLSGTVGQLRVWAENVGAHRSDSIGLIISLGKLRVLRVM
jgi:hypothetical protein